MNQIAIVCQPLAALYDTRSERLDTATCCVDEILYGSPVLIREICEDWIRVLTFYGYTGWMHASDLLPISEEAASEYEPSCLRIVCPVTADILAKPSVKGARLVSLPGGSLIIPVKSSEDGWTEIRLLRGETGFIPSAFLSDVRFSFSLLSVPPEETEAILAKAALRYKCTLGGSGFSLQDFLSRIWSGREDSFRKALTSFAKSFIGTQYRWAGRSPWGIDCSGLVFSCYLNAGIIIYRDAALADGFPLEKIDNCFDPSKHFREAALRDGTLLPGDALFFPGHVAMYLGEGKYIHSTAKADSNGVVINSLLPGTPDFRQDLLDSLYAVGGLRLSSNTRDQAVPCWVHDSV